MLVIGICSEEKWKWLRLAGYCANPSLAQSGFDAHHLYISDDMPFFKVLKQPIIFQRDDRFVSGSASGDTENITRFSQRHQRRAHFFNRQKRLLEVDTSQFARLGRSMTILL